VGRVGGQQLAVVGVQRSHRPEDAVRDDLPGPRHVREPARPHGLEDDVRIRNGQLDQVPGLRRVDREGLLRLHVLADPQSQGRVGAVRGMRRGDVDDVRVGSLANAS
jgi:hypothetical protein